MDIQAVGQNIFSTPLDIERCNWGFKIINCDNKTILLAHNEFLAKIVTALINNAKGCIIEQKSPFGLDEGMHLNPNKYYKPKKLLEIRQQAIRLYL